MRKNAIAILAVVVIAMIVHGESKAQSSTYVKPQGKNIKWPVDSIGNKGRNIIKWNLTPLLLWDSKNFNLSYERILRSHRSISINAGFFRFPELSLINTDSLEIANDKNRKGFSLSFDYRRYFAKRNVRWAPDGLFWGLWTSYHQTSFDNELSGMNEMGESILINSKGKISITAVGAELGYQFLIGNRFTVDLIMIGPAMARYSFKVNVTGEGDFDPSEVAQKVIDALIDRIPGLDELIDTGELETSGKLSTSTIGLRFMIQLGYRF